MAERTAQPRDLDDALYALTLPPSERRAIREKAGLSRDLVAANLLCSPQTVLKWEREASDGGHNPRGPLAARYGALLRRLHKKTTSRPQ